MGNELSHIYDSRICINYKGQLNVLDLFDGYWSIVRCDGLDHFKQELLSLVADSDLLGRYLASLGIVGDELTLI